MRIRVIHGIDDLASDMAAIPVKAAKDMVGVVRSSVRDGNKLAKGYARISSRRHGKLYPRAFSAEMHGAQSALSGAGLISGEYGPDASKPQGGMSFEEGGPKQTAPHRDLARSLDVIGPEFAGKVRKLPDNWFW